jgi:opacity protein-like surface antigen
MKSLKVFTVTIVSAVAFVAAAHAQDHWNDPLKGFYANAGVGVNIMPDIKSSTPGTSFRTSTEVGERISLAVGYMVPLARKTSIGLEFETGAIVNTLNHVSTTDAMGTGTDNLQGYYYQLPFLVNGVLVCNAVPRWSFYAGVGGGGVYSRLHLHKFDDHWVDSNSEETSGAFQLMGGARYQLNPWSEVGIAYKYLASFVKDVEFGNDTETVQNHSVMATYTYHF